MKIPKLVILPSASREGRFQPLIAKKIQKLIKDKLLLTSKEPYRKVQVEVKRRSDGSPKTLVASMLRAYTYTADIVKVNVDPDYG